MHSPLTERVLASFFSAFDAAPTAVVQAPGRVNLIGEHTDYNGGFVLPCAIGFQTVVAIQPRADAKLRVLACDFGHAIDEFRLDGEIAHQTALPWANYVRGVVQRLQAAGLPLRGANLAIAGDVPRGAGLSSSASLEVAVGQAFKTALGLHTLDAATLARIAQQAENDFVGCQCGIMDQLISASGQADHALLIDCRSLATEAVPLPAGMAVMIVDSHVQRGLVDSAYNQRRQQCEAAARHFGLASLRELDMARLNAAQAQLDPLVFRRARHVLSENARTLAAARALREGDLPRMGQLMADSHRSMREDFEITVPAIDTLVGVLQAAIGPQGGARMTGGGFGGCTVALLPEDRVDAVSEAVARGYRSPEGRPGTVHVCHAAAGAGPLIARPA